jgi:putative ABC transport system permease protein
MAEVPESDYREVSPGYIEAMKIAILKGRSFEPQDRHGSVPVVLVNETMARQYFQGEEVIGRKLRLGAPAHLQPADDGEETPWHTVVGVMADVRNSLNQPVEPAIYFLHQQVAFPESSMSIVIRTGTAPAPLSRAVREAIWGVDPNLPISNLSTMEDLMAESTSQTRFTLLLLASFAAAALILAAIGIYGVMSYFVNQRTHEIGLRLALGADRGDILKMIVRQGLILAVFGLIVGLAGALGLSRYMASQLFEVSSHDPFTFVGISLLLLVVAFLAATFPALRATRVEPMTALRLD